jgi:hypothetical protein
MFFVCIWFLMYFTFVYCVCFTGDFSLFNIVLVLLSLVAVLIQLMATKEFDYDDN